MQSGKEKNVTRKRKEPIQSDGPDKRRRERAEDAPPVTETPPAVPTETPPTAAAPAEQNSGGSTPLHALHEAVRAGNTDKVSKLLNAKADISVRDNEDKLPLTIANEEGHVAIVKLFIAHNNALQEAKTAQPDAKSKVSTVVGKEGDTPLHVAIRTAIRTQNAGPVKQSLLRPEAKTEVNASNKHHETPLLLAITNSIQDPTNLEIIERLLGAKAEAEVKTIDNDKRNTLLYLAAKNDNRIMIERLLQAKADIHTRYNGYTALEWAIEHKDLPSIKRLIEAKADATDTLYKATLGENIPLIKCLLEAKADTVPVIFRSILDAGIDAKADGILKHSNMQVLKPLYAATNDKDASEAEANKLIHDLRARLYQAVERNHLEMIRHLIKNRMDVNKSDDSHSTPLQVAMKNHAIDSALLLIEAKADVTTVSEADKSRLLHVAAQDNNNLVVVISLLGARAEVSIEDRNKIAGLIDKDGNTALHLAAQKGNQEAIECLLEAKAVIHAANKRGRTAFFRAAVNGHLDIMKCLSEKKAIVDGVDEDKFTPLHAAAALGHVNAVKFLLEAKANVNACCSSDAERVETPNATPLHLAAGSGHDAVVALLIQSKADIDLAATPEGPGRIPQSPLLWAANQDPLKNINSMRLILNEAKRTPFTSIDAVDEESETAVHKAAKLGSAGFGVLKILLKLKASIHLPTPDACDPLRVAVETAIAKDNKDHSATTVALLRDHGADPLIIEDDDYRSASSLVQELPAGPTQKKLSEALKDKDKRTTLSNVG